MRDLKVLRTKHEVQKELLALRGEGKRIGFVPTMGALHQGHFALMQKAHEFADEVVVSIFVNPTQFGPNEDFDTYPRTFEDDLDHCRRENVSLVFAPEVSEMYVKENYIKFSLRSLGDHLCGASRQGHFDGVIQIVNKLFNIIRPDVAVFGQKDIQQFRILDRMVTEFDHQIEMVMGETVRTADGLALSSRNVYLSNEERLIAPQLHQTLLEIGRKAKLGEITNPPDAIRAYTNELNHSGFKTDYLQIVRWEDLQPATHLQKENKYIIAGAVFLGKTRLIDNVIIEL